MISQIHRHIKVVDCYYRFDIVFVQFIKYGIIERQTFFIYLVSAVRADPGPGDGHPETFEPHFSHQGNVFFVVMIEIRGIVAGIERIL